MSTIIGIWNASGKGKSSSILSLANFLMSTYPSHRVVHCNKNPSALTIDFRLILEIKGKIYALESMGDPNSGLERRLDDIMVTYKPDVLVCATRTRGNTVLAVQNIKAKYLSDLIWSSTYQTSHSHTLVNDAKAEHLHDLMRKLSLI
jgi:hypothetical protein